MIKPDENLDKSTDKLNESTCGCHANGGECSCAEDSSEACGCNDDCACKNGQDKPSEVEQLKMALVIAQDESKKNYDSFLRSVADLDTFRRRIQRDMEDMRKFAIQPLIEELLPSIDNLELGITHAKKSEDFKDLVVGIDMVLTQIKRAFANFGVQEVKPIGEEFDPNFHECVKHESDQKIAENKVISIMRTGYTLNGRLIRPASVVVSSGKKED